MKALALIVGLTACVGAGQGKMAGEDTLKKRAAFDLQCPQDQLVMTQLGTGSTAGIEGCGKRATYVNNSDGNWVMNTNSGSAEPAQTQTTQTTQTQEGVTP